MRAPTFLPCCLLLLGAGCGNAADTAAPRDLGEDPCAQLVQRVCGTSVPCDTPACTSARLTAAHEPDRCSALLADPVQYPECSQAQSGVAPDGGVAVQTPPPPACTALVDKVCHDAADGGCGTLDSCADAREVAASLDAAACRQALDDDTAFPRCP